MANEIKFDVDKFEAILQQIINEKEYIEEIEAKVFEDCESKFFDEYNERLIEFKDTIEKDKLKMEAIIEAISSLETINEVDEDVKKYINTKMGV